jgi:hypothetical protein
MSLTMGTLEHSLHLSLSLEMEREERHTSGGLEEDPIRLARNRLT